MAQWIKWLLCKDEGCNLSPPHPHAYCTGIAVCLQSQHLIGREKGSPRAAWLTGLTESVNFRLSKRPCLDIYGREKTELRKTPAIYLCSAHSHSYMCVYTQTHTLTCAHTWERA